MPSPAKKDTQSSVTDDDVRHEECWAKTTEDGEPGINVRDHCLNVGCVAEALLALFPPQLHKQIPLGTVALAALHDLGKISPGFQVKSEPWLLQHSLGDRALKEQWGVSLSDHAKISQYTVQELLGGNDLHRWAVALGAHHGRIKGERVQVDEPWEKERIRLAVELIKEFGSLPDRPPAEATLWLVAGLITVADWIGSDEKHFPQDVCWDMQERRKRAQRVLEIIQWRAIRTRRLDGFQDLFPEILHANNLQTSCIEAINEPGVYVIEGPMGHGKTEAALAAAYQLIAAGKATGVYFALPTQVTSNRIHLRLQPFVERISLHPEDVRLAHSASWLVQRDLPPMLCPAAPNDGEAEEHVRTGRSWFASAKRSLLTPFGVGTIDQALLGIVAAKHFFVRQFGLAGKVVVLDEVHTYDLYTGTLIGELVKRLRELQCTVIILSATLTERRRRDLLGVADEEPLSVAYPLVSGVASSRIELECAPPPSKAVQIRKLCGNPPIKEAIERADCGECLLWIRNTVDEAQETYRALQSANRNGGPSIGLLHSRFPFFRREQLEEDWMTRLGRDSASRPRGCVLVSTQVAEQSVDIDADLLITDLAPTDMLLQRLGRLWRHDRPVRPCSRPEVWIQMPQLDDGILHEARARDLREALGKSARVYAPYVLLRSFQQWQKRSTITLPDDIRSILEETYRDSTVGEPSAWKELRQQLEKQRTKMTQLALSATTVWNTPALPDEEGVQTRWSTYPNAQLLLATEILALDSHSVRVSLLDGEVISAHDRRWKFDAAKAIHRNLVRVPRWTVEAGLARPPGWLLNHAGQSTAIGLLQVNGCIRWPGQAQQTGLAYQVDQGIIIDPRLVAHHPIEESDEPLD